MSKNTKLILMGSFFLGLLVLAYWNHFNNGFYFDDAHTIVSNEHITDIGNVPGFFKDATTFSSLPANRAYRPMVTTMNAFDYWIAGELDPFYFHLDMFFWYVVQIVLMFFLFRNIMNKAIKGKWNDYIALFGVAFYALHTANAETINYICARSDSFSTLCVIATILLYQYQKPRKYFLYLIPAVIGIYTKQTSAMVAPILFLYILFFEEKAGFNDLLKERKHLWNTIKRSVPVFTVVIGLFLLNQLAFTPESTVSSNTDASKLHYFATQWHVTVHYLKNFLLPLNLSADPDFVIIGSFTDTRIIVGLIVVLALLTTAFYTSSQKKHRPVSFGILWFFLALFPTSSFVPLFQIANDHRTFFPYVGITLSLCWAIGLLIHKYEDAIDKRSLLKVLLPFYLILFIGFHAFGARQRSNVWSNSESLWEDVTKKSPNNPRGLMNYGNTQMAKARYTVAEDYFMRALEMWPYYSYLHTNLGVLKGALNQPAEAEQYFKNGIAYGKTNPEAYYFYGRWLHKQKRNAEAVDMLNQALQVSPGHSNAKALLATVQSSGVEETKTQLASAEQTAADNPTADNYLELSLHYYRNKKFEQCIEAAQKALELKPDYAAAYNNICTAYNQMKEWEKAAEACQKALDIKPDYQLARNNLNWALGEMKKKQ